MRTMQTREYTGSDGEHDTRRFADGTWRQPATFVRDMGRYETTADRLAAMRAKYPPDPGAPAGWTYDRAGGLGDPAYWFGHESPARVYRDAGRVTYNYGEGIGGEIGRPFRFVGFADKVRRSIRHTGWYGDDEGSGFTLFRGVVFRIPARDGAERFVAGYEWGEGGRKFSPGGGVIDCAGRGCIYDTDDEAASAADSMAEYAAEREREYQREESERMRAEDEATEAQAAADEAERLEFADRTGGGD